MPSSSSALRSSLRVLAPAACRLSPSADERERGGAPLPSPDGIPAGREDLPYRVELWNETKTAVDMVLAVTANAGIGFAAYYAATREFPQRYVTLRDKSGIISRWNGPSH